MEFEIGLIIVLLLLCVISFCCVIVMIREARKSDKVIKRKLEKLSAEVGSYELTLIESEQRAAEMQAQITKLQSAQVARMPFDKLEQIENVQGASLKAETLLTYYLNEREQLDLLARQAIEKINESNEYLRIMRSNNAKRASAVPQPWNIGGK